LSSAFPSSTKNRLLISTSLASNTRIMSAIRAVLSRRASCAVALGSSSAMIDRASRRRSRLSTK
jgi:hypothetical protein